LRIEGNAPPVDDDDDRGYRRGQAFSRRRDETVATEEMLTLMMTLSMGKELWGVSTKW
jgi:hypothetical protein